MAYSYRVSTNKTKVSLCVSKSPSLQILLVIHASFKTAFSLQSLAPWHTPI